MSTKQKSTKTLIRLVIILSLTLIAVFVWSKYLKMDQTPTAAESSRALIGGEFELVNHKGEMVSDKDFLGKYMIVYFGYTYCPDVCPMDLQIMADSLSYLSPEQLDQVNPVFVSVDPDRDTIEVMAEYTSYFHEKLIGLTGSRAQIDIVKKAYRVFAAKADHSPDYLVDHTAYTYFMGKDGRLLQHFNHGEDPETMAAKMASYISG